MSHPQERRRRKANFENETDRARVEGREAGEDGRLAFRGPRSRSHQLFRLEFQFPGRRSTYPAAAHSTHSLRAESKWVTIPCRPNVRSHLLAQTAAEAIYSPKLPNFPATRRSSRKSPKRRRYCYVTMRGILTDIRQFCTWFDFISDLFSSGHPLTICFTILGSSE